ncbi:response regulator receiver protein [Bacterioplanes sanyensis]|uniref:Response regulator receiver protein n=1 Tax=Bacterioplanes sanyensis TaxID=1249553 RepID=A0A222FHW8_9GAMM|nr:response regulator [Bacterioplanes sanyensis]ASP38657.1 response regulator receiver protein [Bacterioplanes sanyensis]
MAEHLTLIVSQSDSRDLIQWLAPDYECLLSKPDDELTADDELALILVDSRSLSQCDLAAICRQLRQAHSNVPMVVILEHDELDVRLNLYEAGCDDCLQAQALKELRGRIDRLAMNKIANDQLRMQLQQANEMAFLAMTGTSDLGVNIQFLLDSHHCTNLDELGMRLFQALRNYNLNCSLQLRSRFESKNMEANGMAKAMESSLLSACADKGRYVDFGRRSIMNYGRVSVLVKNMPVDDDKKYGAIKDNLFSLLQGADARIDALDNQKTLLLEGKLIREMAMQMRRLVDDVDEAQTVVMRDIADVVENISEQIENSMHVLGMDEVQEQKMRAISENAVQETTRIFNEGMTLDQNLRDFLSVAEHLLAKPHLPIEALQRLLESGQALQLKH